MAPSVPRFLALLGMIGLSLVVAFVVFLGWWALVGENTEPTTGDRHFVGAALAAVAATLVGLAGLAAGSRVLTAAGILGHLGAVFYIVLFAAGEVFDDFGLLLFVAGGVFLVDLLATTAIVMPWSPADVVPTSPPRPVPAATWQRNTALVAMAAVGLASAALLVWAATRGPLGWQMVAVITGVVGLGGALVCIPALRAGRGSLAVGVAVVQAMLTVLLFLWFGWATRYGLLHVLFLAADVLTIWAGYLLAPEKQP